MSPSDLLGVADGLRNHQPPRQVGRTTLLGLTARRLLQPSGAGARLAPSLDTISRSRMRMSGRLRACWVVLAAVLVVGGSGCGGGDNESATEEGGAKALSVFGAYATPIEEPWDGVIHAALKKEQKAGRIDYKFVDDIGYSGDMERQLREVANSDNRTSSSATRSETRRPCDVSRRISPTSRSCSARAAARRIRTSRSSTTGSTSPRT